MQFLLQALSNCFENMQKKAPQMIQHHLESTRVENGDAEKLIVLLSFGIKFPRIFVVIFFGIVMHFFKEITVLGCI